MEIVLIIIGIIVAVGLIEHLINKFKSISWAKFLGFLVIGGALLALIFSFTAEGVLVILGAYVILLLSALLFGSFSKKTVYLSNDNIRHEIAKNLLDVLDDRTISHKTSLSVDEVKALRLKNKC